MSKTIVIRITKSRWGEGPFSIYDQFETVLGEGITLKDLIDGKSYIVDDNITIITIKSDNDCNIQYTRSLTDINILQYAEKTYEESSTTCMWTHLKNPKLFNSFYGSIAPYIIEYPFSYSYQDEILQNIVDYTKVYKYLESGTRVADPNAKIEIDDAWFNKSIVYNGQQSSGILNIIPKPVHNMKEYLTYPKYNSDSKTITFTKYDNFYQYNNFWSIVKDKTLPLFINSTQNLSYDKEVNQSNMDYTARTYHKEPLRAKDVRIRMILDNRSDIHLVSQLVSIKTQISK